MEGVVQENEAYDEPKEERGADETNERAVDGLIIAPLGKFDARLFAAVRIRKIMGIA